MDDVMPLLTVQEDYCALHCQVPSGEGKVSVRGVREIHMARVVWVRPFLMQ